MRAIRISAPVGVDGLVYEEAPDPTPVIGDVLVRVHACGITADELFWPLHADRAGRDRTPLIPGQEFSGVVVELGYGTAGVAVGDEVYGLNDDYRDGAAAELMAIEARDVAPAPTTIDHVQAASLPQAALTSWQALFDHGHLGAGQTALIHGAAGAVGSIAVQLAKAKDARVIGTGRSTREVVDPRPRGRRVRRPRAGCLVRGRRAVGRRVRHDRRRRPRPFRQYREVRRGTRLGRLTPAC